MRFDRDMPDFADIVAVSVVQFAAADHPDRQSGAEVEEDDGVLVAGAVGRRQHGRGAEGSRVYVVLDAGGHAGAPGDLAAELDAHDVEVGDVLDRAGRRVDHARGADADRCDARGCRGVLGQGFDDGDDVVDELFGARPRRYRPLGQQFGPRVAVRRLGEQHAGDFGAADVDADAQRVSACLDCAHMILLRLQKYVLWNMRCVRVTDGPPLSPVPRRFRVSSERMCG